MPGILMHFGGRVQRYEIVSGVQESVPGQEPIKFDGLLTRSLTAIFRVSLETRRISLTLFRAAFFASYCLGGGWERVAGIQTPPSPSQHTMVGC